jgi:hypothetical protein
MPDQPSQNIFLRGGKSAGNIRVLLGPAGHPEASIWVVPNDKDAVTHVSLTRSYPDLIPEVGWVMVYDGRQYEVTAVSGRVLTVKLIEEKES